MSPRKPRPAGRRWIRPLLAATTLALAAVLVMALRGPRTTGETVVVYKSPSCGCCGKWVAHLQSHGFRVEVKEAADPAAAMREHGVPQELASCHTALVKGYVIEGHVPAEDIIRLLREHPAVAGLAAPGMPAGSPGMDGERAPYNVIAFAADGSTSLYQQH